MNYNKKEIQFFLKNNYTITAKKIDLIDNGVANGNFLINTPEGRYVLKVYRLKSSNEIKYEIDVLRFLKKKNFGELKIIANNEGGHISSFNNRPCVLSAYISGYKIEKITSNFLIRLGCVVGDLHTTLQGKKFMGRKVDDEYELLKKEIKKESNQIIKKRYPKGRDILHFIYKELKEISFPNKLPRGFTHQDIKPENIIISDKNINIIDYDNSYHGILLIDVMTTVIWTCFVNKKLNVKYLQAFLKGYNKKRKFTSREKKYIYEVLKFRLLREIFIWPKLYNNNVSKRYSFYFMDLYRKMIPKDNFYQTI